jgi:hypothetical protein
MTSSRASGTEADTLRAEGGGSFRCAHIFATSPERSNGITPVTERNITQASA